MAACTSYLRRCELTEALLQCDGEYLQCIVMVRDDFWMPISRFMNQLEVPLAEGHTIKSVDRFPKQHAEKVLIRFGQAFGSLPKSIDDNQQAFVSQAVNDLAEDGKVICVRLALFSEMMKDKSWTVESLNAVGGTTGLGMTFLEDTFNSSATSVAYRAHSPAARAVLRSLLPESGTDIKGGLRSRDELIQASGYTGKPRQFDALIHILDSDLRLITPTEPEGEYEDPGDSSNDDRNYQYYQLTHDYLVPSLREWLTRQLNETRRGRAQLRLEERSALWTDKPERRHLPSIWEFLNIRAFTKPNDWTRDQSAMMRKASWFYLVQAAVVGALIGLLSWAGFETYGQIKGTALVNELKRANIDELVKTIGDLKSFRRWSRPELTSLANIDPTNAEERRYQLHAQMAMVEDDEELVPTLNEALLDAELSYIGCLREILFPYRSRLVDSLWSTLHDKSDSTGRRFRAGLALATFEPDSDQWDGGDHTFMVQQLVTADPEQQRMLREYLRPVSHKLLADLEQLLVAPKTPGTVSARCC